MATQKLFDLMTYEDYSAGLALLRQSIPGHPLIKKIESKFSVITCAYLKTALLEIPPPPKKETAAGPIDNPVFDGLILKRKILYTERAKLSNRFYKMIHVSDRVNNSKLIQEIQTNIAKISLTIAYFKENGEMPLRVNPYDLPRDRFGLEKAKMSAMRSRSRLRNEIKILGRAPKKNGDKIRKKEEKLQDYEIKIEHVRQAINTSGI